MSEESRVQDVTGADTVTVTRIDRALHAFTTHMRYKLMLNRYKGGWEACTEEYLLKRLREEVEELQLALEQGASLDEIAGECADVGNFAMFVVDKISGGLQPREDCPKTIPAVREDEVSRAASDVAIWKIAAQARKDLELRELIQPWLPPAVRTATLSEINMRLQSAVAYEQLISGGKTS